MTEETEMPIEDPYSKPFDGPFASAVARRAPESLFTPARFEFDNEQLALMKRTVAKGAGDSEFLLFLELVGRYKLDPFAGHAYLAKMPGKDGAPPTYVTIVSRDGLLAIANRHDDFDGMEGDVVYAHDMIARTPEGFVHTYEPIAAGERLAGNIVGAWARVYRAGRRPTFFLAKFASYQKTNKVWKVYEDAMILKVSESMALRKAFSITGMIGEDEIGARYVDGVGGVIDSTAEVIEEPDWGSDEVVADQLKAALTEANRVRPGSFLPQKVRLHLAGADHRKRVQMLDEVRRFVTANGGEISLPGDVADVGGEKTPESAPQAAGAPASQ